jgi:hypothetical protein
MQVGCKSLGSTVKVLAVHLKQYVIVQLKGDIRIGSADLTIISSSVQNTRGETVVKSSSRRS